MNSQQTTEMSIRSATNEDTDRIKALIFGVLAEYGWAADSGATDSDLEDIEGSYLQAGGLFEIIEDKQGSLVGTVGLYPIDNEVCELRKMYFAPAIRGKGTGKYILERTINNARILGYKRIELETASTLKAAAHLYASHGFKPVHRDDLSPRCDQGYSLDL